MKTEDPYQPDFKECLLIAIDQQSTFLGLGDLLSEDYPNSAFRTIEQAAEIYLNFNKKPYALSCIEATTQKIEAELKFRDSESMYHPDWYECLEEIGNPSNRILL